MKNPAPKQNIRLWKWTYATSKPLPEWTHKTGSCLLPFCQTERTRYRSAISYNKRASQIEIVIGKGHVGALAQRNTPSNTLTTIALANNQTTPHFSGTYGPLWENPSTAIISVHIILVTYVPTWEHGKEKLSVTNSGNYIFTGLDFTPPLFLVAYSEVHKNHKKNN